MNSESARPITRREAVKTLGAGVALAGLAGVAGRSFAATATTPAPALGWDLPALPYAYKALEPHFDEATMTIHHTKHHQAYITNAKNLLKDHADLLAKGPEAIVRNLSGVPEAIRSGVRNNVGGHVNHAFFWPLLAPAPVAAPSGRLAEAIQGTFGSLEAFKTQFTAAAMSRFGSGWAWLSTKPDGTLLIHSTANQDSPLSEGLVPVIGLDVWEHAYYLRYQNRRAEFVAAFWSVLNWTQAAANYAAATKE